MSDIKYNFATHVHGLFNTGGGHTSMSTILEDLDNATDSLKLNNVQNPYILLGHSVENNVTAIMDPGYGTDDIRRVYGCGDLVKKPEGCLGIFMQGGLAAALSLIPIAVIWVSYNKNFPIPLQLSKWNCKEINKILSTQPNQQIANQKIEEQIKVQRDRELTELHPIYTNEIKNYLNNNIEFMQLLENGENNKLLKIVKGEKDNKKFEQLNQDWKKIMNETLFFTYNEFIRRGLVIRDINLDNGDVNELNATEATKMHLLGANIFAETINEDNIMDTPDFGPIDLNKCHYLEIVKYTNKKSPKKFMIFLYYYNFKVAMQFVNNKLQHVEIESIDNWIQENSDSYNRSSARIYISCLSEQERKEQKQFVGLTSDELRKIHIYLKHSHGGVRGLSRIDYPSHWANAALRNFKNIGVAICIDAGNDDIISLSSMKSNVKWENVNTKIINLLEISLLKIIGQYHYKVRRTDDAEDNILAGRKKFLELFGIDDDEDEDDEDDDDEDEDDEDDDDQPVPAPVPPPVIQQRAVSRSTKEVRERIMQMTQEERDNQRSVAISIMSKNIKKLDTANLYISVLRMLEQIPDNVVIADGYKL